MLMKPHWPSDAFEQWYAAYPRKVKPRYARQCFERLLKKGELPPFEVLMSATTNFARSKIGKPMQFVDHPSTWLNGGGWDNDPDALLDVKVSAPVLKTWGGGDKFLIKQGSPQALAWERHRGRSFLWGRSGIWAVDSEWPPEVE